MKKGFSFGIFDKNHFFDICKITFIFGEGDDQILIWIIFIPLVSALTLFP